MKLTRREKHVLFIAALLIIFFAITRPSQKTVQDWEYLYLFLVVGPLGFYLATDPERRKQG